MKKVIVAALVVLAGIFTVPTTASAYLNVEVAQNVCKGITFTEYPKQVARHWLEANGYGYGSIIDARYTQSAPPVSFGDGVAYRRFGPDIVQVQAAQFGNGGGAFYVCTVRGSNVYATVDAGLYWTYLGPYPVTSWPRW